MLWFKKQPKRKTKNYPMMAEEDSIFLAATLSMDFKKSFKGGSFNHRVKASLIVSRNIYVLLYIHHLFGLHIFPR